MADLSIILIDDDEDMERIFEMVTAHLSYDLHVFKSAEKALEYLQDHRPAVIVMDIILPGMDGYQAIERIRRAGLAPDTMLVGITAYYAEGTEAQVRAHGFDAYLPKPLDIDKLINLILQAA